MPSNLPGKGTSTFSVNLRADLLDDLNQIAKALGVSRNRLISDILEKGVHGPLIRDILDEKMGQIQSASTAASRVAEQRGGTEKNQSDDTTDTTGTAP